MIIIIRNTLPKDFTFRSRLYNYIRVLSKNYFFVYASRASLCETLAYRQFFSHQSTCNENFTKNIMSTPTVYETYTMKVYTIVRSLSMFCRNVHYTRKVFNVSFSRSTIHVHEVALVYSLFTIA